jgi:hypothetical protein
MQLGLHLGANFFSGFMEIAVQPPPGKGSVSRFQSTTVEDIAWSVKVTLWDF